MPPLNLNLSNSAKSEAEMSQMGNDFTLGNSGAWNVNVGGTGNALQSASNAEIPVWVWFAVAGLAALWLLKK
ncbi:hypothetical protein [Polaromonas sp.]|uniref:hypothetical protein n=1 Tax=Polaromonas sp. TaxID=1869339 RepID=UPI003CC5F9EB